MWEKREGKRPHIFFDDGSLKLQKIYPTSLAAASASAAKGGSRERERESHHCAAPPPKERVPPPPKTAAKSYSWHCRKKKEDQGLIQRSSFGHDAKTHHCCPRERPPSPFIFASPPIFGARAHNFPTQKTVAYYSLPPRYLFGRDNASFSSFFPGPSFFFSGSFIIGRKRGRGRALLRFLPEWGNVFRAIFSVCLSNPKLIRCFGSASASAQEDLFFFLTYFFCLSERSRPYSLFPV